MKKSFLMLFLLLFCSFIMIACNEEDNPDDNQIDDNGNNTPTVVTKSISVIEESVPEFVILSELDSTLKDIKVLVTKSDDSTQTVSLSKDMISDADLAKLNNLGEQTVAVKYDNLYTNLTLNVMNYAVKVVYPDNTPVGKGIMVQWCIGEVCLTPIPTNANGVAAYDIEEDNYYVHIEGIPAGYTYDPNGYIATPSNKVLEIKLLKLSTLTEGNGTSETPYIIDCASYNLSFEKKGATGCQYFSFTAEEAGNYWIRSIATVALAKNYIDPYFGFFGTTIGEVADADISGNPTNDLNFSYTFEAEAGSTYYFIVFVSNKNETKLPANFEISIEKK